MRHISSLYPQLKSQPPPLQYTPHSPPSVMSSHYRSGSGSSDRPTLPPIRDLFGEELSQSPRHHPGSTNPPSRSFSRLSFDDADNSQPIADERRSYAGRPGMPATQGSFSGNPTGHSPSMRPSSNFPTSVYSDRDRNTINHPSPSHPFTPPGHYRSRPSNDTQFQGRMPSNPAYYNLPGRSTPPNALPPGPATAPHFHRSYSGGGNFYDSRGHYPGSQQIPARGFSESQVHPSIAASSNIMGHSMQEIPMASMSPAKYECDYCGKGFNRPSSLKIHLNSHTGEKPFTCPFEGCGRSFSVLSNMRRHARTHSSASNDPTEGSSDEESDEMSPALTASSIQPDSSTTSSTGAAAAPHQGHQDNNASSSRSHNRPVS